MSDLLAAFGIDWRLLGINLVNFGLLLTALWYFLYAPITKMLESRRQKVANGVRDAERAAHQLAKIEESRKEMLAKAGKEGDAIIANARCAAIEKERVILENGELAATLIVRDAEAEAKELKAQAELQVKKEAAKLIVLGMEKLALDKTHA